MTREMTVFDQLQYRLVTGGFQHGERLRSEELKSQFGCSASTIREALFRLSTLGLVSFQEQKGFRVPVHSVDVQHDITQFRIMLECQGTCASILNGGVDWESRVTAAHHRLSHIERRIRSSEVIEENTILWIAAESEFHETLISACGSDLLRDTHRVIYARFRQQMQVTDRTFAFLPENIQEHQAILDAALKGDQDLVQQKIYEHLKRSLKHPLPQFS